MFALLVMLAGSIGCDSPFDPGAIVVGPSAAVVPASVVVLSKTLSLKVGDSATVAATVKDSAGTVIPGAAVKWVSAAPAVASISPAGVVKALSSGEATIKAASGGASGEISLAVVAAGLPDAPTPPEPTPPVTQPTAPSTVQLPATLESSMPAAPAADGVVLSVGATDDLQAAIDRAKPGDVIELARGAIFTGHFVLPNKGTSTNWIVIRPAAGTPLPLEGHRMTPAQASAARIPRLQSPDGSGAVQTAPGAHHYRLVGLEVTVSSPSDANALISLGTDGPGGQTTLASVPHHLVLDRMYAHGTATGVLRRCIALNSASTAIVDSYLSDCHERGADSQAIMGWNGPGPFKIVNNYLEAAGEIIMFGGSDPGIPNLVPSDIEVRHNHFTRPMSWRGVWEIKNLFELKNAVRVLVEGNVFENNWSGAQDGTAILFKSVNQGGSAPWSETGNVTFRRNVVRNVRNGFSVAAHPEPWPVVAAHDVSITDNLLDNRAAAVVDNTFRGLLTQGGVSDFVYSHNTIVSEWPTISLYMGPIGARMTQFTFADNLLAVKTGYGIFGDNHAPGADSWTTYVASGRATGNVFVGASATGSDYPTGNFFADATAGVGFTDLAGGDFRLSAASPYKGKATDGRDPGVDVAAVLAATSGVVLP
jgi:hypothetical protein